MPHNQLMRGHNPKNHRTLAAYLRGREFYWMLFAMALPVALIYLLTDNTAKSTVRGEAERVASFMLSEVDHVLSEAERELDGYLLKTGGSCTTVDLAVLQRRMLSNMDILGMGVISKRGKIACSIGDQSLEKREFPQVKNLTVLQPQFAEIHVSQGSLPVIIKQNRNGIRVYAVISTSGFSRLLLPASLTEHAQIDIILPGGGLWYALTGRAVLDGFSEDTIKIERASDRFPVALSVVVDEEAIRQWSGGLHTSLIVALSLCFSLLVFSIIMNVSWRLFRQKRHRRAREDIVENAFSLFQVTYQPLLDLDTKLLVGAIARYDLSIFDEIQDQKPSIAEVLELIWKEIGEFATSRKQFNLIVEVDGMEVVTPENRPSVINRLKELDYSNLSLLMRWPSTQGFDADLYRPLEEIATAGCNLAIECAGVRFSLVSDMWTWPYHQLIVDFSQVPESEEAIRWMGDIIINMGEQLYVETLAMGLSNKLVTDHAIGNGFDVGAGNYLGPDLTIDAFMSVVRPVRDRTASDGDKTKDDQKEAA